MMRLLFSFIVFFAVTLCAAAEEVVIDFADPMFAQLDAEGKRLLSEYAKAYPKVKKFYGNIRLDAIVKETNYRAQEKDQLESLRSVLESAGLDENEIKYRLKHAGQTERQYDVRYRSDGYARMDTKTSYTATASKHVDLPLGIPQRVVIHEVGITLFTPAMGYQLSKSDPAKQYFSLNVKRNFGKQNTEGIITVVMYFDTAPFSSDDIPLEHLVFQCPPAIKGKPYIVEYVRQRKVDGENIVEIKCSRTDLMNSFRKIRLIRDSWMVKETYSMSGVTIPGKGREVRWNRETCTYDNIVDGTPLLKTYQRSFVPATRKRKKR